MMVNLSKRCLAGVEGVKQLFISYLPPQGQAVIVLSQSMDINE